MTEPSPALSEDDSEYEGPATTPPASTIRTRSKSNRVKIESGPRVSFDEKSLKPGNIKKSIKLSEKAIAALKTTKTIIKQPGGKGVRTQKVAKPGVPKKSATGTQTTPKIDKSKDKSSGQSKSKDKKKKGKEKLTVKTGGKEKLNDKTGEKEKLKSKDKNTKKSTKSKDKNKRKSKLSGQTTDEIDELIKKNGRNINVIKAKNGTKMPSFGNQPLPKLQLTDKDGKPTGSKQPTKNPTKWSKKEISPSTIKEESREASTMQAKEPPGDAFEAHWLQLIENYDFGFIKFYEIIIFEDRDPFAEAAKKDKNINKLGGNLGGGSLFS